MTLYVLKTDCLWKDIQGYYMAGIQEIEITTDRSICPHYLTKEAAVTARRTSKDLDLIIESYDPTHHHPK